ncbi:phosphotransferase [Rhodococcus sp. X156]|uniref:phosphotransferase family protein n=1 Tax=Rhodococcus sp. X156 TaxID=2499145 RepID=UPI000FD70F8D|nr:phosphotransferase [Rhodococcus sp. X156]
MQTDAGVATGSPGPIDSPAELTADWLTAALRSAGHDLAVAEVRAAPIGVGQIGTNLRLHVRWAHGQGPQTLVVKLAAGDPGSRDIVRQGYLKEVGFYTELGGQVLARVPRCWFGDISADGSVFTLVLDDVADARPGDQLDGCDATQAGAALVNLAGLHASTWCDPTLAERAWLQAGGLNTPDFLGPLMVDSVPLFTERMGSRLSPDDVAVLTRAADAVAAWVVTGTEPFALMHCDYRLDNLMFGADGTVTALDWQTAATGPPGRDVGYFLETSLDPQVRRDAEEDLLAAYLQALRAGGVTGYTDDDAWRDYRLGLLQGPLVTVLGAVYAQAERSERADAMFAAMAQRSCAAIRDHDPFALLP